MASDENIVSEIQQMMYRFGDYQRPLRESALLVEELVRQQINSLVLQCEHVATTMRKSSTIGHEDVLFLMRKDPVKLRRLFKYMEVKDLKDELPTSSGCRNAQTKRVKTNRVQICQEFLESLDQNGEISSIMDTDIFDEVKFTRAFRMNCVTYSMDRDQYLNQYEKARKASFSRTYFVPKFREWFNKNRASKLELTELAFQIVVYFARETVAQIVDLALLVRQDARTDPLQRLQPAFVCNTEYPSMQMTNAGSECESSADETSSCHEGIDASDTLADLSPSSPNSDDQQHSTHGSSAHENSVDTVVDLSILSAKSSEPVNPYNFKFKTYNQNCIQPDDIREAVRRYFRPSGPFTLFSKVYDPNTPYRLLSC